MKRVLAFYHRSLNKELKYHKNMCSQTTDEQIKHVQLALTGLHQDPCKVVSLVLQIQETSIL